MIDLVKDEDLDAQDQHANAGNSYPRRGSRFELWR
jgi:hypothetical protein